MKTCTCNKRNQYLNLSFRLCIHIHVQPIRENTIDLDVLQTSRVCVREVLGPRLTENFLSQQPLTVWLD